LSDPTFALNEAALYFEDDTLVVAFGDGKSASILLSAVSERKLVQEMLSNPVLWQAFLGSLVDAIQKGQVPNDSD